MAVTSLIITIIYHIFSGFIAFVLLWSIIKTKNAQEAILYCIILMPFILRTLHIK